MYSLILVFFFFKQKTAYEMRISDWSSDVCSSDLQREKPERHRRRDHQRSRDALAENRAQIGLCGCGLAACHVFFRSCQLTTAICAWGGLVVKRGSANPIPPCGEAVVRGTVREPDAGGAATVRHRPLRKRIALQLPNGFATGRILAFSFGDRTGTL